MNRRNGRVTLDWIVIRLHLTAGAVGGTRHTALIKRAAGPCVAFAVKAAGGVLELTDIK